jgi:hypothetical protein
LAPAPDSRFGGITPAIVWEQLEYLLEAHWWCQEPGCHDCMILASIAYMLSKRFE